MRFYVMGCECRKRNLNLFIVLHPKKILIFRMLSKYKPIFFISALCIVFNRNIFWVSSSLWSEIIRTAGHVNNF